MDGTNGGKEITAKERLLRSEETGNPSIKTGFQLVWCGTGLKCQHLLG
jgi:hypothetical protein